jgi:stigma-specific protein Stig1
MVSAMRSIAGSVTLLVALSGCADIWQFDELRRAPQEEAAAGDGMRGEGDSDASAALDGARTAEASPTTVPPDAPGGNAGEGPASDADVSAADVSAADVSAADVSAADVSAADGSPGGETSAPIDSAAPPCAFTCSGQCVDPLTDPGNCGGCGIACSAGASCLVGLCLTLPAPIACPGEKVACGAQCINVKNDDQNCGACGNVCPSGTKCHMSSCM